MRTKIRHQKKFMTVFWLFWIVLACYLIPVRLHADFILDKTVYEHDSLSKSDFQVSFVSLFGHRMPVDDFTINTDTVKAGGCVIINTTDPDMVTTIYLDSVDAKSSELQYNDVCYEDQLGNYETDTMEKIFYKDGSVRFIPEEDLDIHYYVNQDAKTLMMLVGGKNDNYNVTFPLTTISSITTKTKVSTDDSLTSDDVKLTINYSDGTSVTAEEGSVSSETISNPKNGKNELTCFYNNNAFKVSVKAYTPKTSAKEKDDLSKIKFDDYGEIQLLYFDTYDVKGATRLNTVNGVVYFRNHRETYYSSRVLPGTALSIPGRHVASDGTIRDKDGYICVASDFSYMSKYSTLLTSLGPAKVYDCGCPYGTIDLYVNW